MASGELANKYNKLEVQRFQEEIDQMNVLYGGVKELNARPGAVFIVDIVSDANAVREANKLKVPIVAMVDTNADPSQVTVSDPGQRRRHQDHPADAGLRQSGHRNRQSSKPKLTPLRQPPKPIRLKQQKRRPKKPPLKRER